MDSKSQKNAIEINNKKKVVFYMKSNERYSLDKIITPIIEDLKTFEIEFERAIESDVRLINSITKFLIGLGTVQII